MLAEHCGVHLADKRKIEIMGTKVALIFLDTKFLVVSVPYLKFQRTTEKNESVLSLLVRLSTDEQETIDFRQHVLWWTSGFTFLLIETFLSRLKPRRNPSRTITYVRFSRQLASKVLKRCFQTVEGSRRAVLDTCMFLPPEIKKRKQCSANYVLITSKICLFDYDWKPESKSKGNAVVGRSVFLKVKGHFRPVESGSSKQDVLVSNAM